MAPNGDCPTGKEDVDTEDDDEYVFARGPLGGDIPLDWLDPETFDKKVVQLYVQLHIICFLVFACLDTEAGKVEASPDEMLGVKLDLVAHCTLCLCCVTPP